MKNPKSMLVSRGSGAVRCVENLRPGTDGLLCPVGRPLKLDFPHLTPFGSLTVEGKRHLVCSLGSRLYHHRADVASGSAIAVATRLPDAPDCAVALSDNCMLMMTPQGAAEVTSDGSEVSVATQVSFGGVTLKAVDCGPLATTVEQFTLNDSADYSERIAKAENQILASAKGAYGELHSEAVGDGRYIQQVIVGFRLFNDSGKEIFRSGPMLLGTSSCAGTISLYSNDQKVIQPYQLSVNTWRPHLTVRPDASAASKVAVLEVVALPQLHLCSPTSGGSVSVTRRSSAEQPFARLRLSDGSTSGGYYANRIADMAARLFSEGRVIAAVANPFSTAYDADIQCGADAAFASDHSDLKKAFSGKTDGATDTIIATFGLPHGFTARCACRSGDVILWGDVSEARYPGYPADMLAAETSTNSMEAWSYQIQTFFRDGGNVVSSGLMSGNRPVSLQALLTYPSVNATRMRIHIQWNSGSIGSSWNGDFSLTPCSAGGFAYYLTPERSAIEISANGGLPFVETGQEVRRHSNLVIATHVEAPTVPVVVAQVPNGAVTCIIERGGNDSAWDHTRSRFFIGSRGGVHAMGVNLNASRPSYSLRRLTWEGVSGPGALTPMGEGAGALLDGPAGVVPVIIGKNGGTRQLSDPLVAGSVVYNSARNELMVVCADVVRVFCGDDDFNSYSRKDLNIQGCRMVDGLPLGMDDSGIYVLSAESPYDGTIPVYLEADFQCGATRMERIGRAMLECSGQDIMLSLDVARIEPDGLLKEPLARFRLNGKMLRGLRIPLYTRPLRGCRWKLEGEVDSSFVFKNLTFESYGK